jgi:hypothetical protein
MYVYSVHQIPESGGDDGHNNNNAATSDDGNDRDDLDKDEDDGIVSAPNVLASVDLTKTIGGL